ncbi:MAG: transcriptional regulator, partial [Okeania sp. SIO3B5]|uniref:GUN4 domain-containing protein n=1 Tax=Okeania sp. SIO3B5 TaxID=2607811 RepID=UPI00140154EB
GHGIRFNDRDYLMPADADPHPDGVEDTAIPLYLVTERLRRCGAGNVILFLDACRSQESSKGKGIGEEKQKGVITIFSCSPNERSYEIENERIQQGSFTYALLESLKIQGEGNCATVERLYNRLRHQVPDINRQFIKPRQTPYAIVEPATKYHLILLEKNANLSDIVTLKNDAYRAEVEKNIELARQLWIRVNIAASGSDMEAVDAISRLSNATNYSKSGDEQTLNFQGKKSPSPKLPKLPTSQDFVKSLSFIIPVILAILTLLSSGELSILENKENTKSTKIKQQETNNNITTQEDKNVDYLTLEYLLKQEQWKEADEETLSTMVKVSNQEKGVLLDVESIKNFPCSELREINELWVKYSNGKFGFSVQKEIYESVGGTKEYKDKVWIEFGDKVGWRQLGTWLKYNELTFNINTPYRGHLPAFGHKSSWDKVVCEFCVNLFSRTKNCKL